jgi:hypothetical protein
MGETHIFTILVVWVKGSATQDDYQKLNMDIGVGFPYVNPTYVYI